MRKNLIITGVLSTGFLLYAQSSIAKTIFVTNNHWSGHEIGKIGSKNGPDAKCNEEAPNVPGFVTGDTYKAMIVDQANNRSTTIDWVLAKNTTYYNIKGEIIGTTDDSAIFASDLLAFIYDLDGLTHKRVFTGLKTNWHPSDYDCTHWDDSGQGRYGSSNSTNIDVVISHSETSCNNSDGEKGHLYCVQE